MLEYFNDSVTLCLALNATKKPLGNEQISDETQLDRIFSRSNEPVYTPSGPIPAKRVLVQHMKFHNPYVFLIVKIVSEEDANWIKSSVDNEYIGYMNNIKESLQPRKED